MHHPFTPVAAVPVDPRRARVHEEGRQSRSPSGAYALDARPHRPGGAVPAGVFQGEGLLALDPGDGSPVRLWAAPDPLREVPSVRLATAGPVAEIGADHPVKEFTGTDLQSVVAEWASGLGRVRKVPPPEGYPQPRDARHAPPEGGPPPPHRAKPQVHPVGE